MSEYNTKQRSVLLAYLSEHADTPQSAGEIASALKEKEISTSAVYRNLSLLEKAGDVRKVVKAGTRESYYQYLSRENCKKHLHLSCKDCGRTFHMKAESSDLLVKDVEEGEEFLVDRGNTILYGICKNCIKKENASHTVSNERTK